MGSRQLRRLKRLLVLLYVRTTGTSTARTARPTNRAGLSWVGVPSERTSIGACDRARVRINRCACVRVRACSLRAPCVRLCACSLRARACVRGASCHCMEGWKGCLMETANTNNVPVVFAATSSPLARKRRRPTPTGRRLPSPSMWRRRPRRAAAEVPWRLLWRFCVWTAVDVFRTRVSVDVSSRRLPSTRL